MNPRRSLLLLLLLLGNARAEPAPLADSTIIVYNKAVPESAELAKFYMQQRGIARDHLVALDCPIAEEITREEYDTTIAEPLREVFKNRHWWTMHETAEQKTVEKSSIRFVALMKGMPLKISPVALPYPGDEAVPGTIGSRNEASVDSELAVLALFTRRISGAIPNPYFQSFRPIGEFENTTLLLVCRLDAPTGAVVKRMILDSIAAEKNGLVGRAYVDGSNNTGNAYEMGDKWLSQIPEQLHKVGVPVVYDNSSLLFPDGYPMTDCALYYGWYVENVTGPFNQLDFHFAQGAIAVHIHSFSAATLRDPNAKWVGPLLARGASASLGNVYEPYLQLTSHLEIFNDRLIHGFTFAESAYMSMPAVSWMSVMVGDPLYRPYGAWLQIDATKDPKKVTSSWQLYHEVALKYYPNSSAQYRAKARQAASKVCSGAILEDIGLMEAKDGNYAAATSYLQQARTCYTKRDDILRVVMEQADALYRQNKSKRALDMVRGALQAVPTAPAAGLLREIEQKLAAAAAPPPKRP